MGALLLLGLVAGVTIAWVFIGFGVTLAKWFDSIRAYDKPQKIELYTTETPAEIKRKADRAKTLVYFVQYTGFFIVWLVVDYYFPVFALRVYDAIIDLVIIGLSLLRDLTIMGLNNLSSL